MRSLRADTRAVGTRVVVSDLDGTLLNPAGAVSARTQKVLEQLENVGWPLVIATSRPLRDVLGIPGLPAGVILVCSSGTVVCDRREGIVSRRHHMEADQVHEVVSALRTAHSGARFGGELHPDLILEHGFRLGSGAAPATRTVARLDAVVDHRGLAKVIVQLPGLAEGYIAQVQSCVPRGCVATWSGPHFCEVTDAQANKAETLAAVVEGLRSSAADVVAFGDMPNDLAMLAWAGHPVAVANAHESVLAAADHVTAANDDDGVARYLEEMLGTAALNEVRSNNEPGPTRTTEVR